MPALDLQQCAAVKSDAQNTLVVAGAGSGKTRVLTERVAHLILTRKVSPYDICCLTFTRKAAQEMTSRLEERLSPRAAQSLNIGTFHAFALKALHKFGDSIGLRPKTCTVYSEWESEFLLKDTGKLIGARPGYQEVVQEYYRTGETPNKFHVHARFLDVFLARLRQNNALTYGQLLLGLRKVLPEFLRTYLIDHVLVDEVQDLDALQWGILADMQALRPKMEIYAVGDQDQSIYAFRGAVPERMSELPHFKVFKLESNYRSMPDIVLGSARLISNNQERIPKTMRPNRQEKPDNPPPRVYVVKDMDSARLAELLPQLLERYPNVGVLARLHALLVKLSQDLTARGVKHTYCANTTSIVRSEDFRRVHAIFKLAQNRHDGFSFALCRELLGVQDAQYQQVLEMTSAADNSNPPLSNAMDLIPTLKETWGEFMLKGADKPLLDLLAVLVHNIPSMEAGVAARIALGFCDSFPAAKLIDYLDWIATIDLQEDVKDPESGGLQLLTIHQSKGLEWDCVVCIGWNEGILPDRRAASVREIEEERRLAYVAMTRARDELIICTRPEYTESKGREYRNPISRFVSELT